MGTEKKFGAFSSSVNPQELSKTVEGVMKIVAGLAAALGMSAILPDINTIQTQVVALIALGVQAAPLIYSAWNAAEAIFGAIRKVFSYFFKTS